MGFAYTIKDQGAAYFVTFTLHQWADVFTKENRSSEFVIPKPYHRIFNPY